METTKSLKELITCLDAAFSQRSINTLNVTWSPDDDCDSDESSITMSFPEESSCAGVEKIIVMIKATLEAEKFGYTYNLNQDDGDYNLNFNFHKLADNEQSESDNTNPAVANKHLLQRIAEEIDSMKLEMRTATACALAEEYPNRSIVEYFIKLVRNSLKVLFGKN